MWGFSCFGEGTFAGDNLCAIVLDGKVWVGVV